MSALWMPTVIEAAVRSTALLGFAAVLAFLLRHRSAALRHLVWTLALAGGLVLPLAGALMPAVPVPVPAVVAAALPAHLQGPTNVLSVNLQLSSAAYPEWSSVSDFYTRLVERVETIPGVRSAASTTFLVLEQGWPVDTVVDGQIAGEPGTEPKLQYHQVSPRYFETVGVPLLSGRAFTDRDDEDAPGVAILNQAAVRRLFPTEDPLGRRIVRVADGIGPLGRNLLEGREVEVVGVVADAKNTGLTTDVEPALFLPQRQFAYRSMHLVVRGEGPPLGLVGPIRETVRGLDLAVPLADIKTLDQHLGAQLAQPRFSMVLLSIFAALALVLASVGLYALMAYSVSRRRRELGVRLALGAQRGQILGLVVRQGMVLALQVSQPVCSGRS